MFSRGVKWKLLDDLDFFLEQKMKGGNVENDILFSYSYISMHIFFFPKKILKTENERGGMSGMLSKSIKKYVQIHCSAALCCIVMQCDVGCCILMQCVAACCSVLQCVAVCCSVLQCVAVYCSL